MPGLILGGLTFFNNMAKRAKKNIPVHQIRSFKDLDKIITDENADMIMGNFYGCVKAFLDYKKQIPELELLGFDWVDDGKIEVREPNITVSKRFTLAVNKPD